MIKLGQTYQPYSAKITKGGKYTSFSVAQKHRNPYKEGYINDGFINVLVAGEYNFERGDSIKITKINGAELRLWNGKQYFSIFAGVEYTPASVKLSEPNTDILNGDIPEELL